MDERGLNTPVGNRGNGVMSSRKPESVIPRGPDGEFAFGGRR